MSRTYPINWKIFYYHLQLILASWTSIIIFIYDTVV